MEATAEREGTAIADEFYSSVMTDLPPRRRRPRLTRASTRGTPTDHSRKLFLASVLCALVSLISAGATHVQAGSMDVTLPQEEAIRALQTLEDRDTRRAAIESLRRHAIQAVRRLEITRDVDIFVGDHAAEALDSIREELQR